MSHCRKSADKNSKSPKKTTLLIYDSQLSVSIKLIKYVLAIMGNFSCLACTCIFLLIITVDLVLCNINNGFSLSYKQKNYINNFIIKCIFMSIVYKRV